VAEDARSLQIARRVVSNDRCNVSQRSVPAQQSLRVVGHFRQRQCVLLGQMFVDLENLSSGSVHFVYALLARDIRPHVIVSFQKPTINHQRWSRPNWNPQNSAGFTTTSQSLFFHTANDNVSRGHSWQLAKNQCRCDTRLDFFSQRTKSMEQFATERCQIPNKMSNYGSILLSFRNITTRRTTDGGRTDVGNERYLVIKISHKMLSIWNKYPRTVWFATFCI